jgi:hypothetical protein
MKGNYLGLGNCPNPNCKWCKFEIVLIYITLIACASAVLIGMTAILL